MCNFKVWQFRKMSHRKNDGLLRIISLKRIYHGKYTYVEALYKTCASQTHYNIQYNIARWLSSNLRCSEETDAPLKIFYPWPYVNTLELKHNIGNSFVFWKSIYCRLVDLYQISQDKEIMNLHNANA